MNLHRRAFIDLEPIVALTGAGISAESGVPTFRGDQWIDRKVPLPDLPPRCQKYDGIARPDVVWFGEKLNPNVLEAAQRSAINARTLLVIGTSALVQLASLLPLIAQQAGASVIEFNLEPTPITPHVDMSIQGPAGQEMPIWWKSIRGNVTGEITVPE